MDGATVLIVSGLVAVLLVLGAGFVFVASVGMLTMPDVYLRMSAATKASTIGVGGLLAASALVFVEDRIMVAQAVATIAFLFFTAPVAAHLIARAAYLTGCRPASMTTHDDLVGYFEAAPDGEVIDERGD